MTTMMKKYKKCVRGKMPLFSNLVKSKDSRKLQKNPLPTSSHPLPSALFFFGCKKELIESWLMAVSIRKTLTLRENVSECFSTVALLQGKIPFLIAAFHDHQA
jgi:hypothetical protein